MLALFENELRKGTGVPLILLKKNVLQANDQVTNLYLNQKNSFLKSSILKGFSETKIKVEEKYLWAELKKTKNLDYKSAIIEALMNFNNTAVKVLVNQYYNNEVTKVSAVKAFIKYIDEKDRFLLEHYIEGLSIGEIHCIMDIIDYERIKQFNFYPMILRKLYEKNVCSVCRKKIIKKMIEINCLDDNLLEEIKLDCNKDIRKIAYDYENKKNCI